MTLQQLRYFLAAAEHGSFSAAAESLLMAQPSLSEQIRRLEAELGVALFTRAGRRLVLTEAGRMLRPARRADARRRGGGGGVGQGGPHAHGRHGELRHVRQRAPLPARRARAGLPPALSRRARARRRPELRRGRRRRARGRARGRADRAAGRRPRARGPARRSARRTTTSARARSASATPKTIEEIAAAPLILYDARWGAGRPDAPAAQRARAARRRADRAARSRSSTSPRRSTSPRAGSATRSPTPACS